MRFFLSLSDFHSRQQLFGVGEGQVPFPKMRRVEKDFEDILVRASKFISQSVTQADYLSIYSEMDVNKSLTITKSGINHVANKSFQEIMQSQEELLSLKSVYEIFTCCVAFDCGPQVSMGYKQKYSYIVCVYRIETT